MAEARLLLDLVPPSGVADIFLQRILGQLRLQDLLVRPTAQAQPGPCSLQLTGCAAAPAGPAADVQAAADSHPGLRTSASGSLLVGLHLCWPVLDFRPCHDKRMLILHRPQPCAAAWCRATRRSGRPTCARPWHSSTACTPASSAAAEPAGRSGSCAVKRT